MLFFSEMLWNIDNWMKYTYLKRLSLTFIYLKYREQVKYSGIFVEEKFESIWFSTANILLVHYSLIWFATVYTFLIVHYKPYSSSSGMLCLEHLQYLLLTLTSRYHSCMAFFHNCSFQNPDMCFCPCHFSWSASDKCFCCTCVKVLHKSDQWL